MATAGIQTTKLLYFTITLLGLVCLASSLMDKDKLEKLKETVHRTEQQIDRMRVEEESAMAAYEENTNKYLNQVTEAVETLKKTTMLFSDDFPTPDGVLKEFKDYVDKTKTHLERAMKVEDARREEVYKEVRKMKELIKCHEDKQATQEKEEL